MEVPSRVAVLQRDPEHADEEQHRQHAADGERPALAALPASRPVDRGSVSRSLEPRAPSSSRGAAVRRDRASDVGAARAADATRHDREHEEHARDAPDGSVAIPSSAAPT